MTLERRDSATIDSTAWTSTAPGSKRQTVTITVTANYTVARIRLYSGAVLYFEGTISPAVAVTAGSKFTVTVTITASLSVTHSGGTLVSYTVSEEGMDNFVDRFTIGTRRGVKPDRVRVMYGGVTRAEFTGTVSVDEANIQAKFHAEHTPETDLTMNAYEYILSDGNVLLRVSLETLTLYAYLTHTWDLVIQF
jgi:hypothetical protein